MKKKKKKINTSDDEAMKHKQKQFPPMQKVINGIRKTSQKVLATE